MNTCMFYYADSTGNKLKYNFYDLKILLTAVRQMFRNSSSSNPFVLFRKNLLGNL